MMMMTVASWLLVASWLALWIDETSAEDGTVNELGVVQHRGADIDRLCGVYRTLAKYAERAQKAAGIDPNA